MVRNVLIFDKYTFFIYLNFTRRKYRSCRYSSSNFLKTQKWLGLLRVEIDSKLNFLSIDI